MITITPQQLRKAADIQEKIQSLQKELGQLLGAEVSSPVEATKAPRKKGKMSARGLANIRAAQKARWAKIKGVQVPRKRKLSAQGLANIRAGVAKRMAAQGKAPKRKRKMTAAWRKALERAWAARRAKARKAG